MNQTEQGEAPVAPGSEAWAALPALELNATALDRNRIVSHDGQHPARTSFDILRTRLLRLLADNHWKRLAITSSKKGAGKTFVALNLALSLARNPDNRVMLVDLDLRAPGLAKTLHWREPKLIEGFLAGEVAAEDYFLRIGGNLMVGLNTQRVPNSSELILSAAARRSLDEAIERFQPTVVLYDLPPLMVSDDTIGVLNLVDGALLVAAAGETRAREITECERLVLEHTHLLGVILNKGEDGDAEQYGYG